MAAGLFVVLPFLGSQPARAQQVAVTPAASIRPPQSSASAAGSDQRFQHLFSSWQSIELSAPVGHVTVSRASDAPGRPVYAARQAFSGSDRMIGFSTQRPAMTLPSAFTSLSTIALPAQLPVRPIALTSGFGYRHHPILGGFRVHAGVDLAAAMGTPVAATSDGVVNTAGWQGGYGLLVSLDHPGAVQTRYGHLSRLNVVPGQQVHKGDVLGFVGSTGMSTGPHLHYEVRLNGQAVDPLRIR